MKLKTILIASLSVLLILSGLFIIMYPEINKQLDTTQKNKIIDDYEKSITETKYIKKPSKNKSNKEKEKTLSTTPFVTKTITHRKKDLSRLKKDIKAYNKRIYKNTQIKLNEKTLTKEPINLLNYGFNDKTYGYIEIRKIHLKMPIYLGCSDYNMSIGAAQLGQTSIPFGGKNTNAVIAGHCGYGYRDYFRHIEKLRPGDVVRITTPFNKLKYIVKKRKIVKPKNRDEIRIQDDKDMVTLFTCYPYPTNKYRCCIICERESD